MLDLTNIWGEVSSWPPEQRLALATRLLQSLKEEEGPVASSRTASGTSPAALQSLKEKGGQVGVLVTADQLVRAFKEAATLVLSQFMAENDDQELEDSEEQTRALQQLIGIWKTELPPSDEQVELILEQERMKKYG